MIVNNNTNITSDEAYSLLIKSSKLEYAKKYIFNSFIFIVGIPILVVGLVTKNTMYIVFGSIFVAFSLVLCGFNTVSMIKIPKMVKEKNAEVCEYGISYSYRFKEHSVILIAKSNDRQTKYEYSYTTLKRITEYSDKYQLRFQDSLTLYVYKSGFENQKMEEFFRKNISTSKKKIKLKK